jgi:hypothetical protein
MDAMFLKIFNKHFKNNKIKRERERERQLTRQSCVVYVNLHHHPASSCTKRERVEYIGGCVRDQSDAHTKHMCVCALVFVCTAAALAHTHTHKSCTKEKKEE